MLSVVLLIVNEGGCLCPIQYITEEQRREWSANPACTCDIGEPDAVNLPGKYLFATKVCVLT